jgi:hypothetical protein
MEALCTEFYSSSSHGVLLLGYAVCMVLLTLVLGTHVCKVKVQVQVMVQVKVEVRIKAKGGGVPGGSWCNCWFKSWF